MSSGWVPGLALLAACAAGAACGRIGFGATSGDGGGIGDDDGGGSGSDLSGTCLSPGYGDGFDELFPCNAIGMPQVSNGGLNVMNSEMTLTPNANVATSLGCARTSGAFGAAGTFIEIGQVLPSPGQTLLTITSLTNGYTAGMFEQGGLLAFTDSGGGLVMHPYNPTADRWWRIRPAGGRMLAETSPDGKTWAMMGATSSTAPNTVSIAAYVQTDASNTAPGTAVFQGIDVCPP
jgi:hypothetical protein